MVKYKVLKEFVDTDCTYVYVGEEFQNLEGGTLFIATLEAKDFIEPIKENTRWTPEKYEDAYYLELENNKLNFPLTIARDIDIREPEYFRDYNVFKSMETAEKVAEALRLFFEWLHDTDTDKVDDPSYSPKKSMVKLSSAMDKARDHILNDDEGAK